MIQDPNGQISTYPFPPNIADQIPLPLRKDLLKWMLDKYIWPQVQARKEYEHRWDRLLQMARASLKYTSTLLEPNTRVERARQERARRLDEIQPGNFSAPENLGERLEISDTVIFDAIDRLTNLSHFISFKESLPVQFSMPEDVIYPEENGVYSPMSAMVRSANAWMKFIATGQDVYRKGWMTSRHHYTYGVSFVDSQYTQKIEMVPRRQQNKTFVAQPELTEIAITFEPISLRKLWLNPRLNAYDMNYQACPFFFDEMPRFAVVTNTYDPQLRPFGFVNTDKLPPAQWLFTSQETESWKSGQAEQNHTYNPVITMDPQFDIELLWTFYAMLPIGQDQEAVTEDNPQGWVIDMDGTKGIPLTRWIVQTFGNSLCNGQQEFVRIQRNFYPNDSLPLFGSAHMPTLDDGAYPMSIGDLLENHYMQICKTLLQVMENKDLMNDPPVKIAFNSPAMDKDLNLKGGKIPVNTMNDFEYREVIDGTMTAPQFLDRIRNQAKTSSKATEAILGQAMGARTSATEASNVFQTAMSGVTTDINLFAYDIYGQWARRVWDYSGRWVDPDVLAAITGSYGFALKPEHMAIRIGLKYDIGSSFIESITRQNNLRYLLESTVQDPSVNRPYLMRALLKEWRFKDVDLIINDQGLEENIQEATDQSIQTYLGNFVMVDPDQDHQLAIKVKTSFLKDRKSVWNSNPQYAINIPKLIQQIQQHQMFLQIQQMQMQLQQQRMLLGNGDALQPLQSQSTSGGSTSNPGPTTGGQQAQQVGGTIS